MRAKASRQGDGESSPPEVRAGLVLVKPKGNHNGARSRWVTTRGRTWVLPLMRVVALAVSMLCLSPTGGMGTGLSNNLDAWRGAGLESEVHQDYRSQG